MSLNLDLESIILFLFFIAPGFLFTRTYIAYRPRYYHPLNTFEQLALAIVGSVVIHATIFAVLAVGLLLIYGVTSAKVIDLSTVFLPGTSLRSYPIPVLASVIVAYNIYLAISLVLARRFATFLGRRTQTDLPFWWSFIMGEEPPEPFLLWHTVLQVEPLELNLLPPHVTIHMRNGEYFEGDLSSLRLVGDEENTIELALRQVIHSPAAPDGVENKDAALPGQYFLTDQVVLLKSTDILWLSRNDIPR
jgi:hypothetical protein